MIFEILNTILKDRHRVDVAADNYRTVSWKNKTRYARGEANRTIMKSVETKTLDSREFLNNNYNKTELVDQIFYWFKINQAKAKQFTNNKHLLFKGKLLCDVNILIC